MKAVADLVRVIYRPGRVFERIREQPSWLVPALLILVTTVVLVLATAPVGMRMALDQLAAQGDQIPPAELARAREMIQSPVASVISMVSGLIAAYAGWLIQSVIFHFLASAFGGSGTFVGSLSLVGYAWVPVAIRQYAQAVVMSVTGGLASPGLAALLSSKGQVGPLGALLGSIDIFTVWNLALLVLGLVFVYKISRGKATGIAVGYWVVTVVVAVALALVAQSFAPAGQVGG